MTADLEWNFSGIKLGDLLTHGMPPVEALDDFLVELDQQLNENETE